MTTFEWLVLETIRDLGQGAHGVAVCQEVEKRHGKFVSLGALFVAYESLENENLITHHEGETAPGRGGRPRHYYAITRWGEQALLKEKR